MQVAEVVERKRLQFGMPMSELARRTGIDYQALNNALNKRRKLSATELVLLCRELDLDLESFGDDDDAD